MGPFDQPPYGCVSKLSRRGYAGFGPCFHLPGVPFGTGFLSHSHISSALASFSRCQEGLRRPGRAGSQPHASLGAQNPDHSPALAGANGSMQGFSDFGAAEIYRPALCWNGFRLRFTVTRGWNQWLCVFLNLPALLGYVCPLTGEHWLSLVELKEPSRR